MWTRRELKTKAKETLHLNYWKTVLVALVFTLVCSGAGFSLAASGGGSRAAGNSTQYDETTYELSPTEMEQLLEEYDEIDMTDPDNPPIDEVNGFIDSLSEPESASPFHPTLSTGEVAVVAGIIFVVAIVVVAIALALSAFLTNPVEVGTARFFTRNLNQKAEVKEVAFGFDNNYLETVKTMFWRDVYTLLWGLLLIVPGIVKAYEYRMIPYLLADDPTMTKDRAFAESKRMMTGNKWRAFVLDLSFIGWYLLALPTLGLVTIFYASPYKKMTDAALYEELRYGQTAPRHNAPLPAPAPTPASAVPVPPFAAENAPAPVWDDGSDDAPTSTVVEHDPQA
jgi:uncharacterized membrane protein